MATDEKLKSIRQNLINDQIPQPITVRTFLSWFGFQRRTIGVIEHVKKDLQRHDLITIPDFTSAYIDASIVFDLRKKKDKIDPKINIQQAGSSLIPEELIEWDDPTYRISRLEAANKDLVFIKPDSDLNEAITKMISHDFSQLPVMQQAKRDLKGVISWKNIGMKSIGGKSLEKVRDCMETNPPLISSETSLFKALPLIIEHDYVIVQNSIKEICGIVTASDLSLQFKQLTEPFLLVSEIERHLRQLLAKLPLSEIEKVKDEKDENRKIEHVSDLTFGEYLRLFQHPQIWIKLHISFDRATFCNDLESIRIIRNNIMHFDPDGLEDSQLSVLRNFIRLLQAHLAIMSNRK